MKTFSRRRIGSLAAAGVGLLTVAVPGIAVARDITPGSGGWSSAEITAGSTYHWDASVPSWLKPVMQDELDNQWDDSATNNSKHIHFSYSTSGTATVWFKNTSGVQDCDALPIWYGCANNGGATNWNIWLRASPGGAGWCDVLNPLVTGCIDAGRVAIHEIGHVGGYLAHNLSTQSNTLSRMTTGPAHYPAATWDSHTLGACDEARMQLLYDVASNSWPYAACFDAITGAGSDGLKTVVGTVYAGATWACYGQPLSLTGYIRVGVDSTNYGPLSNNSLQARSVYFDRMLHGGSTWTVDYTSTVSGVNDANGYNWDKSFSVSGSSGTTAYDFRGHFKGSAYALSPDYGVTLTLTWSTSC